MASRVHLPGSTGPEGLSPALAATTSALADGSCNRDSRSRLCSVLVELGSRSGDPQRELCIDRSALADAAEVTLTRAKRILAFLDLSGIIEQRCDGIRVIDWRRLCRLAQHDCAGLGSAASDDEDHAFEDQHPRPDLQPVTVTLAGDPASFV